MFAVVRWVCRLLSGVKPNELAQQKAPLHIQQPSPESRYRLKPRQQVAMDRSPGTAGQPWGLQLEVTGDSAPRAPLGRNQPLTSSAKATHRQCEFAVPSPDVLPPAFTRFDLLRRPRADKDQTEAPLCCSPAPQASVQTPRAAVRLGSRNADLILR